MAARLVGADPIIGVDINPQRLKLAMELGATQVIDNRHARCRLPHQHITGSGVDYVLEITGDPSMHQLAIEVLNPHGTVALIARPNGSTSLSKGGKPSASSRAMPCRKTLSLN